MYFHSSVARFIFLGKLQYLIYFFIIIILIIMDLIISYHYYLKNIIALVLNDISKQFNFLALALLLSWSQSFYKLVM